MSPTHVRSVKATRPVPVVFHDPPSDLVLENAPVWADCQLNEDIVLLGCRIPPKVQSGRAFSAEVLLRVAGPLRGRWEGRLTVCSSSDNVAYTWTHPIADGVCPPNEWKPGALILNRTWVRPPQSIPEGTYSLRFDFVERDTGKTFCPLTKGRAIRSDQVVLSSIEVTSNAPEVIPRVAKNKGQPAAELQRIAVEQARKGPERLQALPDNR